MNLPAALGHESNSERVKTWKKKIVYHILKNYCLETFITEKTQDAVQGPIVEFWKALLVNDSNSP